MTQNITMVNDFNDILKKNDLTKDEYDSANLLVGFWDKKKEPCGIISGGVPFLLSDCSDHKHGMYIYDGETIYYHKMMGTFIPFTMKMTAFLEIQKHAPKSFWKVSPKIEEVILKTARKEDSQKYGNVLYHNRSYTSCRAPQCTQCRPGDFLYIQFEDGEKYYGYCDSFFCCSTCYDTVDHAACFTETRRSCNDLVIVEKGDETVLVLPDYYQSDSIRLRRRHSPILVATPDGLYLVAIRDGYPVEEFPYTPRYSESKAKVYDTDPIDTRATDLWLKTGEDIFSKVGNEQAVTRVIAQWKIVSTFEHISIGRMAGLIECVIINDFHLVEENGKKIPLFTDVAVDKYGEWCRKVVIDLINARAKSEYAYLEKFEEYLKSI